MATELEIVARNLKRWQKLIEGQRHTTVSSPALADYVNERLDSSPGLRERANEYWSARDKRLEELKELYGKAVAQVPGAVDEDLVNLDALGLLLLDTSDDEANDDERNRGYATLTAQGDGSYLVSPQETGSFKPDGRIEELKALVREFIKDINTPSRFRQTSAPYPEAWNSRLREAVDLKRKGRFVKSAKVYVDLSRSSATLYTGILPGLYKTVACGGDLVGGELVLINAESIYARDPNPEAKAAGISSSFMEHFQRLVQATRTRPALEEYLRDISGNNAYQLPRDYSMMISEWNERRAQMKQAAEKLQKLDTQQKAGCYIATAVYGSYDAPQVLTLRRFRDERLAPSSAGRAFIRLYYALSPTAARHLERASVLNRLSRRALDAIVERLEA